MQPSSARSGSGRTGAVRLPRGYWSDERVRAILDRTITINLPADLSRLGPGSRRAVGELISAGRIVEDVATSQRHHQGLRARRALVELHRRLGRPARTTDLLALWDLNRGPIATTLENELLTFVPADGWVPGRAFYPWGIAADEIETFLQRRPDRRAEILDPRTIVRRTSPIALRRDLAALRRHGGIAALHPGYAARLATLAADPAAEPFYAVPYSLVWPDDFTRISGHLVAASAAVADEAPDFAAFLRLRSRDILADDLEGGDAAWVRGTPGTLDAVIGTYEVYQDDLFGVKTMFDLTIHLRDEAGTAEAHRRMRHLGDIERALPLERPGRPRHAIPIGSYDVVATFGDGHGTGAEILPNDPELIRKYGRKILIRRNLYFDPGRIDDWRRAWTAIVAPEHHDDLTANGRYQRVLWHEIGHYLGPDTDAEGRDFEARLGEDASLLEELKADLIAQFATAWLARAGEVTEADRRAVMAGGVFAGLKPVKPLRTQVYPTLELMQLNKLLEDRVAVLAEDGLRIRFAEHEASVVDLLRQVLALQDHGTKRESSAFIERYSTWDDRHERIAARLRAQERYRFVHVTYPALGDGGFWTP